jgi:hypothetical protein
MPPVDEMTVWNAGHPVKARDSITLSGLGVVTKAGKRLSWRARSAAGDRAGALAHRVQCVPGHDRAAAFSKRAVSAASARMASTIDNLTAVLADLRLFPPRSIAANYTA